MKIVWTEPALLDMEGIRDYIRRDSEHYANRFVEKIIDTIERVGSFPSIGRHVPETEEEDIREVLLYNYRIMYRVENERILILAIIHGSRDMSKKRFKPWDII